MFTIDQLLDVVERMEKFPGRWCVAGGFAIELFVGKNVREHSDIEIGLLRQDQLRLRAHFPEQHWEKAITVDEKGKWVSWEKGEVLELPVFQLKTFWADRNFESEFFLDDGTDEMWTFRREPSIRRKWKDVIRRTPDNIPILAPEIQLLYKAKHHRAKDEQDFLAAVGLMFPEQRKWLKAALRKWNKDDKWISEL